MTQTEQNPAAADASAPPALDPAPITARPFEPTELVLTSSPPPRHNFISIPRIRSERPAFEHHYPHRLERLEAEAHAGPRRKTTNRGAALERAAALGAAGTRHGAADPGPGNGDPGSGPNVQAT